MRKITTALVALTISANSAFAETPKIVGVFVDRPDDKANLSEGVEIPKNLATGTFVSLIRVYPGMNTNGEDLKCLEVFEMQFLGDIGRLAPSCNWTQPKP